MLKVKRRVYKNVCGKCHVCETLKTLTKQALLRSDRLLLREYKLLHRQQIMGEKIKYQERRLEAAESTIVNGVARVQSLIFDSMTKRSTALPTFGNKAQFKGDQFTNNLMGCISHVQKHKTLYTSYGSVDSGASYMIHCIHSEASCYTISNKYLNNMLYLKYRIYNL